MPDTRAFYYDKTKKENLPGPSLADLYNPNNLCPHLHKAHADLDKASGYNGIHDDGECGVLFARLKP